MGACNSGCAARACQAAPLQRLASRRRVRFASRVAGDSPRAGAAAACADAAGGAEPKIHEQQPLEADRPDQAAQQLDGEEPTDEEPEPQQPAPKRRGRKPTGCVTRAQLLEALSTEREDQEAEEGDDAEGGNAEGAGAAEQLEQEAQVPAPKRRGRKATGMVTQAQLLAAKQRQQDDGDEDDCDDADDPGSSKGEADSAVPQNSTQPRVVVVVSEITDEGSESDAESDDGPAVVRKATGCVTKQQLLEVALREGDSDVDSDDPESSDEEEGGAHPKTTGAGRRAAVAAPEDNGEAPEPDELPAILTATAPTRRRGRKATGVVTKEQLLGALSACGEEEENNAENGAPEQPEKQATQSEPSVVEEVADKAAELPAGWLCCRGHAQRWHGGSI